MSELTTTHEWKDLKWRKIERQVWKLQKRIYKASQRGDKAAVQKLQRLLMKSWSAKCLAVRRVTQDNQGKQTAGVDGVKSLTPKQRLDLVKALNTRDGIRKAKPTRRVWIPKPGREEKRPLGIPTMFDRAMQALARLALEPEWEAKFEPNQYGFRPGRSCQDAIGAIFNAIRYKAKYVLDADIAKCFDCIDHMSLIRKIDSYPTMNQMIKAWLKAGVLDKETFSDTSEGTPQGGVISPLLANIALHGMESVVNKLRIRGTVNVNNPVQLIRYADDFVILHENLSVVQRCKELISEWLTGMGLELKPSKTRICHTLQKLGDETPGFDFLGFNIRQYQQGKHRSGKNPRGKLLGFKTIITPSKEAVKVHYEKVAKTIDSHKAAPQISLISRLNPIIRGWTNYNRTVSSKQTYSRLGSLIFNKLQRWAYRRHPEKSKTWVVNKYWHTHDGDKWVFSTPSNSKQTAKLLKHASIRIIDHVKVKGEASPFDGNAIYWSERMGKHPTLPKQKSELLKLQGGKCAWCGTYFKEGDLLEIDHKQPLSAGGSHKRENLQLLHRHCHDEKSRTDQQGLEHQQLGEWLDANPW